MQQRKSALVTGSGTGVGAATALQLAQRGYDVLINYARSEREARESEAACRAAGADTLLMRGDAAAAREFYQRAIDVYLAAGNAAAADALRPRLATQR